MFRTLYGLPWRRFDPWVGKIPWGREWLPAPIFFPGDSHGQGLATIHAVAELDITEHTQAWLAKLVIYF